MKNIFTLFTIFLLLKAGNVSAAEIISSDAKYEDGKFIISVDSYVKTSPKDAFRILTDYKNIPNLSPKIIESKIIESKNHTAIIRTVVKGCVMFFCKKMTNTQITTTYGKNRIESNTIPGMSDFEFGKMTWKIRKQDEGTVINYYAEIEPSFFVPPLIGSYFIKKSMREEAEALAKRIEEIANESQTDQL